MPKHWTAIELRLGEGRAGQLLDLLGLAQLLVLASGFLQAQPLANSDAFTDARVDLGALDSFVESLRSAGCRRFNRAHNEGCPVAELQQTHGTHAVEIPVMSTTVTREVDRQGLRPAESAP